MASALIVGRRRSRVHRTFPQGKQRRLGVMTLGRADLHPGAEPRRQSPRPIDRKVRPEHRLVSPR